MGGWVGGWASKLAGGKETHGRRGERESRAAAAAEIKETTRHRVHVSENGSCKREADTAPTTTFSSKAVTRLE